jgi:large repetitive protein
MIHAYGFAANKTNRNSRQDQARQAWTRKRSWTVRSLVLLLAATGAHAQFGTQPVGAMSGAQLVTVTAQATGTVTSVELLTMGAQGTDYAVGGGGSTCATATFSAVGQTCTESVTFTPLTPGLRAGAVVLLDAGGNVLATEFLSGSGSGGLGVISPGNLTPVAGNGNYLGSVLDGHPATGAELYLPSSMVVDGAGNMYIADSAHNRIRMVCASATSATITGTTCTGAGIVSTIAGNGNPAYSGDGGVASSATVNDPSGVALDGAGNLYIADAGNNAIRMIRAATGAITTIAGGGSGCGGQTDTVGDGCAATNAILNSPQGVTLDGAGNLYIADTSNHRIRMVAAATGTISTVAGKGTINSNGSGAFSGDGGLATLAELNYPQAIAFDASGNMYIPDTNNNRVRKVLAVSGAITAASTISTFAGNGTPAFSGDGAAANVAALWGPSGVAVDAAGNVYIADTQNNIIRKVSPATLFISSLVKNNTGTYYLNGVFSTVYLYGPTGLYLDGLGNLYIADTLNMVVREVQGNFAAINYTSPVRQFDESTPISRTVENQGNLALDLTAIVAGTNTAIDATTTTCNTGSPLLPVAANCTIGAVFAPSVSGNPVTGTINVGTLGDTADAPLQLQLVGNATAVNSTTTVVSSSLNPAGFGQSITFTATVTTGASAGNLTGKVTFYDGATVLAADVALAAPGTTATATFSTSVLTVGKHSITASFNGDTGHSASTSTPALTQDVLEATSTSLTSSANPSALGQSITFTATVVASAGGGVTPSGSITFFDGSTILGNVALNGSAKASFSTAALTAGAHAITASYGGDSSSSVLASTSAALAQSVQTATAIAVASSQNPSDFGVAVVFTATVAISGSAVATGTVDFYDAATKIGTAALAGAPATASFSTSLLNVATHAITAKYGGDSSNAASTSAPLSQVVVQTQTATTASATPNPGIGGVPIAITATVHAVAGTSTPLGQVTFTSGTTTLGSAALSASGTATINPALAPGQYSVVASYAGDTNDGASAAAAFALTVNQATTQTAVGATPNPAIYGATVTFTAKVTGTGAVPTGTVTFAANGTVIGAATALDGTGSATLTYAGLAAGSYTITAAYSGDTNDQASTGTGLSQLVVTKIATSTSLSGSATAAPNPKLVLVATVLTASGATPTGTVTFNEGTTAIGTVVVDSNGVATLIPNLASGNHTVVAVYSGDATHSPSTSPSVTVAGTGGAFTVGVTPSTLTIKTSESVTVPVTVISTNGFADTIALGCASLPTGVTCHFSPLTVALAANGTMTSQLTIDTNNPLSGGASAMNTRNDSRGTFLAGIFLPFGLLFGAIFWRFRKRQTAFMTVVLVTMLSAAALFATGCSGFSMSSVAAGKYVIQVTGSATTNGASQYQNVTLNVTN